MSRSKNIIKGFTGAISAASAAMFGGIFGTANVKNMPGGDIPVKKSHLTAGAVMLPSPLQKGYFCPAAKGAGTQRRREREAREAARRAAYYADTPQVHRWSRQAQRALERAVEKGRDPRQFRPT